MDAGKDDQAGSEKDAWQTTSDRDSNDQTGKQQASGNRPELWKQTVGGSSKRRQGLDTDARVIYVGTFSKVVLPALRLG
jgi:hypothetical protein